MTESAGSGPGYEVVRAHLANVVRWFLDEHVERSQRTADTLSLVALVRCVDAYAVLLAYTNSSRMDRFDRATGQWRPLGSDGVLEDVIVDLMVQRGADWNPISEWFGKVWFK